LTSRHTTGTKNATIAQRWYWAFFHSREGNVFKSFI